MILDDLGKNNLHHAYLVEGEIDITLEAVFEFIKSLGIKTSGNPDVSHIALDSFKVDDARSLKSYALERGFSESKKVFIISANNFLLEAQNSLLKIFEEPIENTHFFVITPDVNVLLPTLVSRFYVIGNEQKKNTDLKEADNFINMPARSRLDFIKNLLIEEDDEDEESISIHSPRSKAIHFLNTLELALHNRFFSDVSGLNVETTKLFAHFFKVREFLRQPGSSPKTLMESIALMIPEKI